MITRFRIEAKAETKQQVEEELSSLSTEIQNRLSQSAWGYNRQNWRCTQEAISGSPGDYQGRMVFLFSEKDFSNG